MIVDVHFTGSLQLPDADIDGLTNLELAELIQERVGHTGTVVIDADPPGRPLPAHPRP